MIGRGLRGHICESYPSSIKSDNKVASSSQWKMESSESDSSLSMLGTG